jgi:hypothetical protein
MDVNALPNIMLIKAKTITGTAIDATVEDGTSIPNNEDSTGKGLVVEKISLYLPPVPITDKAKRMPKKYMTSVARW